MTTHDLIEKYESQKKSAEAYDAEAPVAKVLDSVIEDLKGVKSATGRTSRYYTTEEVAERQSLHPRTISDRCADGYYEGAFKTSEHGEWRIPVESV